MSQRCRELRERLTSPNGARNADGLERHLASCATCRRYTERLATAQRFFRDHHGNVEPDAAFADRVAARLPHGQAEALGWAAMRLLPATLVLALVLAWLALTTAPRAIVYEDPAPTEDLLGWVLEPSGDGP